MKKTKSKIIDRILAMMLSFVLVVGMIPTTAFAAAEESKNIYTITVVEEDGKTPVSNATIKYSLVCGENSVDNKKVVTNGQGIANIDVGTVGITEEISGILTYEITCDNYKIVKGSGTVNTGKNTQIKMNKTISIVKVNVTGNAKVKLTVDGTAYEKNELVVPRDTKVKVEIVPEDGSYVKTVSKGNVPEKYKSYIETYTADEDITINATVMEEVKIGADAGKNGKITINGKFEKDVLVDKNSEVEIAVIPNEGYQIESITVNDQGETVKNPNGSILKLKADKSIHVEATFVKVYTVAVVKNGSGTITVNSTESGGTVVIENGRAINISAQPDTNWRVSAVVINGEWIKVSGANDSNYETTLSANKDYKVEVTFALNQYKVSAENSKMGTISIGTTPVEYGKSSTVTVEPNDGYAVSKIKVNEKEWTKEFDRNDDEKIVFTIDDIKENQNIEVTFVPIQEIELEKVSFDSDYIRCAGQTYVYAKNKEVTFTTNLNGIRLYKDKDKKPFVQDEGFGNQKSCSVTVKNTVKITKIEVYSKVGWQYKWQQINKEDVSSKKPIKIVIDQEEPEVILTADKEKLTKDGFYNESFDVDIKLEDPAGKDEDEFSGIDEAVYWVTCNDEVTQDETPLVGETDGAVFKSKITVLVDENRNNSDNVKVHVRVSDKAGNEKEYETSAIKVNCTAPILSSITIMNGTKSDEAEKGYYNVERTAEVVILDKESSFSEENATKAITIEAVDETGKTVIIDKKNMISWDHQGDIHTATIRFSEDANYNWHVEGYSNKAELQLNKSDDFKENGENLYQFTVDKTAPTGKIQLLGKTWERVLEKLTFGLWTKDKVTAKVLDEKDMTSPLRKVTYCKVADSQLGEQHCGLDELELLYKKGEFKEETITIDTEQKFVIYARVADYAGNVLYLGTDGAVFDNTGSSITITPDEPNKYGFYNSDVKVNIQVSEGNGIYSGIKSIDYKIIKDGNEKEPTQSENLYRFNQNNPTYDQLKQQFEKDIVVETKNGRNNSDNILVRVMVEDNAGNVEIAEKRLSINTTPPKTTITMDNQEPNAVVDERGYYSVKKRTATITVMGRTSVFDAEKATEGINVIAKDFNNNVIEDAYSVSKWSLVEAAEDAPLDTATYTATITFEKDANYEWYFSYTNKAGNTLKTENITVEGKTPFKFTVDDEDPYGSVSIEENKWTKLLDKLTFGLFDLNKVDVKAMCGDAISPVKMEVYKTNSTSPYTWEALETIYKSGEFKLFEEFSVGEDKDENFVVYLRITDQAGNYKYISSDGYTVDKTRATIQISAPKPNENGYYKESVPVTIKVEDPAPYSGIKSIQYWVEKDENKESPTQEKMLYVFDYVKQEAEIENSQKGTLTVTDWATGEEVITKSEGIVPTYSDLKSNWSGTVTVDAELNDSCNVKLYVKVIDNAGNETVESIDLDIDHTAPTIALSYDNNTDNGGNTYFNAQRRATVVITERTHHFDSEKALEGIKITAKDAKKNVVEEAYTISAWDTVEGETPDEATHTATVFFEKDANYTLDISYTDDAGNENSEVKVGDSTAPFRFTVDTTAPTGTITAESEEGRKVTWEKLRDTLTFGFWSKKKITISCTTDDSTSEPIGKVEYYKVQAENANDNTTALTETQLNQVKEWKDFQQLELNANQQFVVYLKITDLAGNYTYISTNGLIVDDQAPVEEMIAPEITITPEQPINDIYNRDVKVAIQVKDPLAGGTYSGLKNVTYEIRNMGKVTQAGTLYKFDVDDPKQEDLQQSWSGEIVVDSKKNNSNDVEIIVYGQDNSLNDSEDSRKIKIDVTAPKIRISYNNNNVDSDKYFKENRTATITVTERNFNAQDVVTTIKNTDGFVPKVSAWKKGKGTGNGDDVTWTATVKYTRDGDYTFGIQYTDLAGNRAKEIGFAEGTAAGKAFTIDKTIPKFTISYDNNAAQNGNYYKASRTATIRVIEHNFDASRVIPKITASDNGKNIGTPGISSWKHKGDVHTATITYSADALYTFDISMKDKAGNEAQDYAEEKFYVDKTMPKLTITGVKNHSANTGDVIPVVSFSDTNFDSGHSTITLTGANRGNVKLEGSYSNGNNGRTFVFKNFAKEKEVDDIYTLSASTTDKAGNTVKQTVTFSVNRFGSTYELSRSLQKLNGSYVKEAGDIVLTEINPDALKNVKITLFKNNETMNLKEGENYKIQASGGNGEWYRYKYTIFKENFAENGVYRINVSSEDAAGNVAENTLDTKNQEIGFGVDAEKPLLNITNLEDHQTYPVEELTVLMTAKDNLILSNLVVYLDGEDVPFVEWTAEEIAEILSGKGEFTFTVAGDSKEAHSVKIVAKDAAGNEEIAEIKDFYVTTDVFVRFFNNKPLLYGSTATLVLLAGLALFLILKKKKDEEENKNS